MVCSALFESIFHAFCYNDAASSSVTFPVADADDNNDVNDDDDDDDDDVADDDDAAATVASQQTFGKTTTTPFFVPLPVSSSSGKLSMPMFFSFVGSSSS